VNKKLFFVRVKGNESIDIYKSVATRWLKERLIAVELKKALFYFQKRRGESETGRMQAEGTGEKYSGWYYEAGFAYLLISSLYWKSHR